MTTPKSGGAFRGKYGSLAVAIAGLCAAALGLNARAPGWCMALLPVAGAAVVFEEMRYAKLLSRQRVESERLRRARMRFRNAFQEASVGMVILGCRRRGSQSRQQGIYGSAARYPDELVGKFLLDYISPEHHADVKQQERRSSPARSGTTGLRGASYAGTESPSGFAPAFPCC